MLPTPGSSAFLRERLLFDLIFVPFRSQQVSGTGLWADSATSVWSLLPHPWTILSDTWVKPVLVHFPVAEREAPSPCSPASFEPDPDPA